MLCDNSEEGLWFVFPFSRITDQNLKPHLRNKYKFDDEVANEKGYWFVLANYVFTLNTVQWSNCAVDLTLFKVIWYWLAFGCNATTIKLIKCNATQIWLFRHIISMRNHHITEKKQTGKNIFIMLRCFFLPSGVFVLSFIFNISKWLRNMWLFQTFCEHWFFFFNPLKCTNNVNKELKTDISKRGNTWSVSSEFNYLLQSISEIQ